MSPVPLPRAADFGPLIVNTDIDEMILGMLSLWLPHYMAQVERERNFVVGYLDRPKDESYANALDDDEFLDHSLPAVIVTTAHTEGVPEKDGDGFYSAAWNVVVSCVVRGRTPSETRSRAALFEGCVRRVLMHADPPIDGEIRFTGANTAAVADPTGTGRYLAAGISTYLVYVDKVVQAGVGPAGDPYADPTDGDPNDPFEELVTVGSVTTVVDGKTPQGELT